MSTSRASAVAERRRELALTLRWILVVGTLSWLPLAWLLLSHQGILELFSRMESAGAAIMFLCGAVIANATAVGGGMIFNPTLQAAFGVGGYAALFLSVLVQCAGMSSGCYGWYRKGQLRGVERRSLYAMVGTTLACTLLAQLAFLVLMQHDSGGTLRLMRTASAGISFYVTYVVWKSLRSRSSRPGRGGESAGEPCAPLRVDRRMFPWLALGSMLNVATAVGSGELAVSHLVKYYSVAPSTAVAIGTTLQAASVLVQGAFILFFFGDRVPVALLLIGLLFCMVGGRLAPLALNHPRIQPWVLHGLAATALTMGLVSAGMVLARP